jgi:hypothetical protein
MVKLASDEIVVLEQIRGSTGIDRGGRQETGGLAMSGSLLIKPCVVRNL